jgi:hypothetical protein
MAIGVVMDFDGATVEQYDQVIEKMGLAPRGAGAQGGLFHWIAPTESGIRITDVWDTREQFEQFAAEQIGPITQEVGFAGPPTTTYYEVHNYLTAGS